MSKLAEQPLESGGKSGLFLYSILPYILLVSSGITISILLFIQVSNFDVYRLQTDFERQSSLRVHLLQESILNNLHEVHALHAFFSASELVTREEFAEFSKPHIAHRHSIRALEWIPRVPHYMREEYEKAARDDALHAFQFIERNEKGTLVKAADREEYYPIYFAEPRAGNEAALGFDTASEDARRTTMEKSRDAGMGIITPMLHIIQGSPEEAGFLIFVPLYREKTLPLSTEARRKNLSGFVATVFTVNNLLDEMKKHTEPNGINIYLYDISNSGEDKLIHIYRSRLEKKDVPRLSFEEALGYEKLHYSSIVEAADRKWLAFCAPARGRWLEEISLRAWGLLMAGLLLTAIITGYVALIRTGMAKSRNHALALTKANEKMELEIRERSRVEEILKEAQQITHLGSWEWDISTGRAVWSEEFYRILGMEPNEVEPSFANLLSFVHPDDREIMETAKNRMPRENGSFNVNFRIIRRDGSERFLLSKTETKTNRHNTPARVIGTVHDITEQKLAENALRASKLLLEKTFASLSESIFVVDPKTRSIVECNPVVERMFGYTRDEVIGRNTEILHVDRKHYEEFGKTIFPALDSTGRFQMEYRMRRKDGSIFDSYHYASDMRDDAGNRIGVVSVIQDITEQKRTMGNLEREVKINSAVAELSAALIASASIDEISMLTLEKAKALTGSEFGYVGHIDPETGNLLLPVMTRDIWEKCKIENKSSVAQKFNGLGGWVLKNRKSIITNSPSTDERSAGTPPGHIPVRNFISAPAVMEETLLGQIALANSDREYTDDDLHLVQRLADLFAIAVQNNRAQNALRKSHEELEKTLEELKKTQSLLVRSEKLASIGTLSAGVAHEILNPLNIISTIAQLMEMENIPDGIRDNIREVAIQVKRATRITNNLRMFAHQKKSEMKIVNINDLFDKTTSLLEHDLMLDNISIVKEYGNPSPMIMADEDQMAQVFLNLLTNARDAMKEDGGNTIKIRTKGNDNGVTIFFSDNGPGIPKKIREQIFDPFFTTKDPGKGTGLGLSIVYSIIERHEGIIKVASKEGKGTKFTIYLPSRISPAKTA